MADKKISALTAATTPLAGTEVLPIVQSSVTKKVATDDLTVKNIRSNATTGILQVAGPGAAATRTMTVPDANFTAARIDAANSFTGDQTLATGNLIIGTSAKGIDFSANPNAPGMTSELLNDYETGTWTPFWVLGSVQNIVYTSRSGTYTKIGNIVHLEGNMKIDKAASTVTTPYADIRIGGLPFNPATTCSFNYGVNYGEQNPLIACPIITGAIAGGSEVFLTKAQGENVTAWAGYSDFDFTVSTQIQFRLTYSV